MPYADPECKRRWAAAHRGDCPDCGKTVSRAGRRCGSCAATHWQKEKGAICAFAGCEERATGRGWCPLVRATSAGGVFRAPEERFWSKVDKDGPTPILCPELGPCWIWTASLNKGYGQAAWGTPSKMRQAYKVAYELLVGPVPEGLDLDHLCETKPCVNPAHLEPVTHAENVRRAVERRAA